MNTPMYHLPELQGRLKGNPREMRSAVVNEFHRVNPVQLGREGRGRRAKGASRILIKGMVWQLSVQVQRVTGAATFLARVDWFPGSP